MRDTVEILRAAIAHHQAANHAEAETLYRTVLIADPGHPRALYLCGLLLLDTGRPHDAASMLEQAAASRPGHAGSLINLMRALLADRRPDEALAAGSSCALRSAEVVFLRGTALNALGRPGAAVALLEEAVALDPANAAAFLTLATPVPILIDWQMPRRYCRRAIQLAPGMAEAHASLGFVLTSCGRLDEAIAVCETAHCTAPDSPRPIGTRPWLRCSPGISNSAFRNMSGESVMIGSAATSSICQDRSGTAATPRAERS